MKIRKMLAIVLSLVMLVSLIGCGSNSGGSNKGGSDSELGELTPERKYTDNDIENPYKDLDLQGASIKIGAPWNIEPKEEGSSTSATLTWQRIHYLEDKYNCKFEFVTSEDTDRLTSSVAAGQPYVDFVIMYTSSLPSFAMNGYLQNLDEIKCIDVTNTKWNSGAVSMGAFNNAHYSFTLGNYTPRYVIAFNKTLFEKNNWESPYELYKNNNWTWEKMIELAQKATDKSAERYGFGGLSLLNRSVIASYGGEVISIDDDGIPKFSGDSNYCKQAIQLFYDIRNKYDVSYEPATYTWDTFVNAMAEGKVAMAATQLYLIRENILDMEDDYGIVPVPKASTESGRYTSLADDVPVYVMLANNPLAQEKAYILDLYTEPYAGYEDILSRSELETYCRDEDSVEILLDVEKKYLMFDYSTWFTQAQKLYSEAIGSVLNGSATFAEAIGGCKTQIEQSIADVYASWNE